MKNLKVLGILTCIAFLSGFFNINRAQSQCPGTTLETGGNTEGCKPSPINFNLKTDSTFDQVTWQWGDGTSSIGSGPNASNLYDTADTFIPTATLTKTNGDTICTVASSDTINIYDNPEADFLLPGITTQCFKGNEFCFTDQSVRSANNASITDYLWSFGDGLTSTQQNPCHSYNRQGTYTILLQITDDNGCVDTVEKSNAVTVRPDLNAQFAVNSTPNCPSTEGDFNNLTNKSIVDSFYWRFDDGNWDSTQQNWDDFSHTYYQDGKFFPTLYVKNQFGCTDSFNAQVPVKNINYEPKLTTIVDTPCYSDPEVQFQFEPEREDASFFVWNFGNPQSGPANTNEESWAPSHEFVPEDYDTFHITLQIQEEGCPKTFHWDMEVKLHGPQASIKSAQPQQPPKHDFQLPQDQPIPRDSFVRVNNNPCLLGETAEIEYVEVDSLLPSDTVIELGGYPILDGNQVVKNLQFVTDTLGTKDNLETWTPGDKIPDNQVFGAQQGTYNPQSMHDTDLFVPSCNGPNLVRFTNNTTKTRYQRNDSVPFYDSAKITNIAYDNEDSLVLSKQIRYDTILNGSVSAEFNGSAVDPNDFHISFNYRKAFFVWDQKPASNTGLLTFEFVGVDRDQTHFPYTAVDDAPPGQFQGPVNRDTFGPGSAATGYRSAPWGSDSLEYLWSFNDPDGEQCTTTTAAHSRISEFFLKVETTKQNYGGTGQSIVFDNLTRWDTIYNDEVTVYNDSGNEISQNYNVQIGQNAQITFPGGTPNQQTLSIEYTARDNSMSGTLCNFSTAWAPWHKYEETGCHIATLSAFDPVTNCESTAQVRIVMDQPDAGWDESFFWEDKSPQFIYNETINSRLNNGVLLFDSLMTYANQSDRIIDFRNLEVYVNGNLYSETKYTVDSTAEGAKIDFSIEPTSNSTVLVEYEALRPYYLDQNTPIAIKNMSYQNQQRFPEYQPGNSNSLRRGLMLDSDGPCPSPPGSQVNYWQELNFEETIPNVDCGIRGKRYGFIYSREELIEDTLQCNTGEKITYDWYETPAVENPMQLRPPFERPSQYQYSTPGCKTLGLWVSNGGCVDTFWYEDYIYITELFPQFSLLDNATKEKLSDEELETSFCMPIPNEGDKQKEGTSYDSILKLNAVADKINQDKITEFSFQARRAFPRPFTQYSDRLKDVKDTGYVFCDTLNIDPQTGDTTWQGCFAYPVESCQNEPINDLSPDQLAQTYLVRDTQYIKSLNDTATNINIGKPGVYSIRNNVTNATGCFQSVNKDKVYVGHYSDFEPQIKDQDFGEDNDTVLCPGDTILFHNPGTFQTGCPNVEKPEFPRYWNREFIPALRCERFIGRENYFKDPKGARDGELPEPPFQAEQVAYDLDGDNEYETEWVPSQQRYYQDGALLPLKDVDNDGTLDTVPFYAYNEPGIYKPTVRSIDSTGCVQINELTRVNVVGVEGYLDTANAPSVCAPQTVNFVDNSDLQYNYHYEYDTSGNKVDSSVVDSIETYRWDFGDSRSDSVSFEKDPTHVYTRNGDYEVWIKVETEAGCRDSSNVLKHKGVKTSNFNLQIAGPRPNFAVIDSFGCNPSTIQLKDKSNSTTVWNFDKGNGQTTTFNNRDADSTFNLQYQDTGTFYVSLVAGDSLANTATADPNDSLFCQATYPRDTTALENREDLKVEINSIKNAGFSTLRPSISEYCPEDNVTFINESDSRYDSAKWTFGDGTTVMASNDENVTHSYDTSLNKTYDVRLLPQDSTIRCPDTATKSVSTRRVKARIDTVPNDKEATFEYINKSENSVEDSLIIFNKKLDSTARGYTWNSMDLADARKVEFKFDSGQTVEENFGNNQDIFTACVIAKNDIGCKDTACIDVENRFDTTYEYSNVFTPNNDGKNDYFQLKMKGDKQFDITIFNRWGEKVFEAEKGDGDYRCETRDNGERICKLWDGTNINSGNDAAAGTYYYVINYRLRAGEEKSETGTITLIR